MSDLLFNISHVSHLGIIGGLRGAMFLLDDSR